MATGRDAQRTLGIVGATVTGRGTRVGAKVVIATVVFTKIVVLFVVLFGVAVLKFVVGTSVAFGGATVPFVGATVAFSVGGTSVVVGAAVVVGATVVTLTVGATVVGTGRAAVRVFPGVAVSAALCVFECIGVGDSVRVCPFVVKVKLSLGECVWVTDRVGSAVDE